MTTPAKFKKQLKESGFIDKMESLGFQFEAKDLTLFRIRGEYLDFISFNLGTGKHMTIPISCVKYSLLDYDMTEFPKGIADECPFYSSTFINNDVERVSIGGSYWKIKEVSDVEKALEHLYELVLSSAEPWLKNIDTDEKLYESWTVNFKESDNAKRLKKILLG